MARPRKSSFYHTRRRVGLNLERTSEVLGVNVADVERFDLNGDPLAEKVLLLWDQKHVNVPGWDGFLFSRGVLRWKNHRWTAKTILLWRDQADEISRLEQELQRLKSWRGLSTVFVEKLVNR